MMLLPFLGETLSNLQGLGALHVPEASGASEVLNQGPTSV